MSIVTGLADRLLFAAGLVLFLQIPQFIDHYTQRYAGYHQALADSVRQYQDSADAHYGGDLPLMIHEFETAQAPAMRDMGAKMQRERRLLDEMTAGLARLRSGSLPAQIAQLARDYDSPLLRATFEDFEPGLPFTQEAAVCGLVGGILASGLFNLLIWPLRRLFSHRPMVRV
ncbi:DUF2937 family protein [Sinimarinibacterium thermocellulolyticum]|uniref:DUF2937 family protein n=1 Tax=Sinimarinibacterium thermocellulolyticum TaxID=3170016 RepID=A0ABV2ABH2_9GAMM